MDPTMFLAASDTRDPNRPDASQIDAFYAEHGAEPFWTSGVAAPLAAWRLLTRMARKFVSAPGDFAQRRLRMLD